MDVRDDREWDAAHVEGSTHAPYHSLETLPAGLDPARPVAVFCGAGPRRGGGRGLMSGGGTTQRRGGLSAAEITGINHPGRLIRRRIEAMGGMAALGLRTAVALIQPPFVWRREFVNHCIFIAKVALIPIALSIAAWGFSGPGLQAGNFLSVFGSIDRAGGFMAVAIVREFGTFVTATVVAGVVGTTITAELGARKVRGELDALAVMGVDPVRHIVAPRVLALAVSMMVLDVFALLFGVAGGYLASVGILGGTTGGFLANFFANTTALDLVASVVKVGIFGVLIGVISSYKGLNVSGGSESVGRAVNDAVVGCLLAIFLVNLVYTQYFLAAYPEVGVFR